MSETEVYFGLAFRAKAMPYYGSDDYDEGEKFFDLMDKLREFTDKKFNLGTGQDFFILEMQLGGDWDGGYYGLWSYEKLKAEVDQFWPKFLEWMFEKGHDIQPYGEVKYFLEIFYNGTDSQGAMSHWEDI
jgi:hypothetical protein